MHFYFQRLLTIEDNHTNSSAFLASYDERQLIYARIVFCKAFTFYGYRIFLFNLKYFQSIMFYFFSGYKFLPKFHPYRIFQRLKSCKKDERLFFSGQMQFIIFCKPDKVCIVHWSMIMLVNYDTSYLNVIVVSSESYKPIFIGTFRRIQYNLDIQN